MKNSERIPRCPVFVFDRQLTTYYMLNKEHTKSMKKSINNGKRCAPEKNKGERRNLAYTSYVCMHVEVLSRLVDDAQDATHITRVTHDADIAVPC